MDQLGSILTAVLTITTIIGVALAGLQRGVVQNLREANKDLRDRDSDRDKREAELEAKCDTLEADLSAAHRFMRNETQIAALGEEVHQQGEDLRSHRARLEQKWDVATQTMSEFSKQILDELRAIGSRDAQ